jgi:hypothetical protein
MPAPDKTTIRSTALVLLLASAVEAQEAAAPAPTPPTTTSAVEGTAPAETDPGASAPAESGSAESAPPSEAGAPALLNPDAEPEPGDPAGPRTVAASAPPAAAATAKPASPPPPPPSPPPPEPVVLGDAAGRLQLGLGLGVTWIGDEGFDLFSASDALPQAALKVGLTVWQGGSWSVLGVLSGDYAGAGTTARGTPTHVDYGRLLLGAEVRGHVLSGFVGYGRLLAGPALIASRVGPAGADDTLALQEGAVAVSAALGAAVRLYGSRNGPTRSFRLEAYVEGGYDFASEIGLIYLAGPDGPERPEPLDLGTLSTGGPVLGLGLQGSY